MSNRETSEGTRTWRFNSEVWWEGQKLIEGHLGLKPDWGELNVRNFREGAGNVTRGAGLRPTAKAVATPPDPTVGAPALYPTRPLQGQGHAAKPRPRGRHGSRGAQERPPHGRSRPGGRRDAGHARRAAGGERYRLLNGREEALKTGDMMMADRQGVISSVLSGPDQRTLITPETRQVFIAVYAPPGIGAPPVRHHFADLRDTVLLIAPDALIEALEVHTAD
jgi:hypothetical protein